MEALTTSLNSLVTNFQATRTDTLAVVRDFQTAVLEKINSLVWEAHRETVTLLSHELTGVAGRIEAMYRAWMLKMRRRLAGFGLRSISGLRGRRDLLEYLKP